MFLQYGTKWQQPSSPRDFTHQILDDAFPQLAKRRGAITDISPTQLPIMKWLTLYLTIQTDFCLRKVEYIPGPQARLETRNGNSHNQD